MRINKESPPNISAKLGQYDQVQRQLHKLKFHLRMKRKLYDESQYKNVSERVKECEDHFKKMKRVMITEEANRILGKSEVSNRSKSVGQRKEAKERETRVYNRSLMKEIVKKEDNYKIKLNSERFELSKSKYIVEYQLCPTQKIKSNKNKSSISNGQRYVSDFQRKIKERLQKLPLQNYEIVEEIDQILKKDEINLKKTEVLPKANSLKLHSLTSNLHQTNRRIPNRNSSKVSNETDQAQSQRYVSLRQRIDRCRTELSQRQKDQIKRISQGKKIDCTQKNRILNKFYLKYASHQKNGDPQALDLMCAATLARADLFADPVKRGEENNFILQYF